LRGQMGFFGALNRSDASRSREALRHHRDAPPHYTFLDSYDIGGGNLMDPASPSTSSASCDRRPRAVVQTRCGNKGPAASGHSEANPRLLIYQCSRLQPIPVGPRAAGPRFSRISVLRTRSTCTAAIGRCPIGVPRRYASGSALRRAAPGPEEPDRPLLARSTRISPGAPHPAQLQCASNLARPTQPPPVHCYGKPEYCVRRDRSGETSFSVNNLFERRGRQHQLFGETGGDGDAVRRQ
jgi:hypothetical protein